MIWGFEKENLEGRFDIDAGEDGKSLGREDWGLL